MAVNPKRQKELRTLGFVLQNDKEHFSVKFLSKAGSFTIHELRSIANIAEKYGRGHVNQNVRLQIEVPWIKDEDVENVIEEAKLVGLKHGGGREKIKVSVACKGVMCSHGNIDTKKIYSELEEKYLNVKNVPYKCKIGAVGCINNCGKANINDIGIMGRSVPDFHTEKCIGCGLCVKVCKENSLSLVDKKVVFNKDLCVNCGDCIRACKFGAAYEKQNGAEILVGGRFGRKIRIGDSLGRIFKQDEVVSVVDVILEYYIKNGQQGERISSLIDRIGKEKFIHEVLNIFDKES